ncbi:hypothetical protein [Nonomuraea sp. NPDC002799]
MATPADRLVQAALDPDDEDRLDRRTAELPTLTGLGFMLGGVRSRSPHLAAIDRHCRPDHAAVLLFPHAQGDVAAALAVRGFQPMRTAPSTVVRNRLAGRYHLEATALDVTIVHARHADHGAGLEVFVLVNDASPAIAQIIAGERAHEHESHYAFTVPDADEVILHGLRETLTRECGFIADGGGFNPHDGEHAAGKTVLYFTQRTPPDRPRRLELTCGGHHPSVLRTHLNHRTPHTQTW